MKEVFQQYGEYYDLIYSDKDYEKECDFIEEIFGKYSKPMPKTILDAGCGTGNHAIPLSRRGFTVTGVDASETMIRIAKDKARKNKVDIDYHLMDLKKLKLDRKFDACVSMFAVMGYMTENQDVVNVLHNIRSHLNPSSIFIFDFWYGPAVLTIRPTPKMKTVKKGGVQVLRFAEPHLDTYSHLCEVSYSLIVTNEKQIVNELKEKHVVRYFFPKEIDHYLSENNLKLLKLCPFLDLSTQPTENTWNATAIAEAI
jgi:2-polyprenyl-3-methyl-5-hydroxy-6-metoxy-1,4-benzoquinol methylase